MSPPSWWSGLKYDIVTGPSSSLQVSTLVVEWIEILSDCSMDTARELSPPSWWSGLKSPCTYLSNAGARVSTLVVEWIEICNPAWLFGPAAVSTLVVEWIEII